MKHTFLILLFAFIGACSASVSAQAEPDNFKQLDKIAKEVGRADLSVADLKHGQALFDANQAPKFSKREKPVVQIRKIDYVSPTGMAASRNRIPAKTSVNWLSNMSGTTLVSSENGLYSNRTRAEVVGVAASSFTLSFPMAEMTTANQIASEALSDDAPQINRKPGDPPSDPGQFAPLGDLLWALLAMAGGYLIFSLKRFK